MPGGEDLSGRSDRGYELLFELDEFRLIELEMVDGHWVEQQE